MLSSVFMTACGKDEEEEDETEVVFPVTLTLWLPAAEGSEIDDESIVNVENAINEFTQANYKTAIKLKVFPAEVYDSYVLSKIYELRDAEDKAAAKAAEERRKKREEKNSKATDTETTLTPEETAADITGIDDAVDTSADTEAVSVTEQDTSAPDTTAGSPSEDTATAEDDKIIVEKTDPAKYILPADEEGKRPYDYEYKNAFLNSSLFTSYPQVESDQFDIFLIHGYEEFELLNNDYLLCDLYSNLYNESRILLTYLTNGFLGAAIYQDTLGIIPNNRAVGEAQVMLVNKKVCEDLSYDPELFTKVESIFDYDGSGLCFLEDVIKNKPGITPVAGDFTIPNLRYFSETDDDTFSLICAQVDYGVQAFGPFIETLKSPFEQTTFVNNYRNYKKLHALTTPVDFESADEFAVGFFKGTTDKLVKYSDDYQIVPIQYPQLTRDDVYKSGYAVCSYSKNLDRAMEIISAINTNTELRTILQYGKEGVHWRYDMEDTSIIRVLNDKYQMDINETGNAFVTYPGDGIPISGWDVAKRNNMMAYVPYDYGLVSVTEKTAPLLKDLAAKSKDIFNRIEAMSLEEFNSNLDALKAEVNGYDSYIRLTYPFDGSDPKKEESLDVEESLPQIFMEYATNVRGW